MSFGLRHAFARFFVSGAFTTLASYAAYLLLLLVLPYRWSYTLAYAMGIVIAYVLYRFYVFKRPGGALGPFWVAMVYLLQYTLGLGLVTVWVQLFEAPAMWAPLFSAAVTMPLSFLLNRKVFRSPVS